MNRLPAGILLAAGQSRRFGSNKLLHPLADGTPMLFATATTLATALPETIVVINHDLSAYTTQLEQLGMRVVINEQAGQGMGTSIARGVAASGDAAGWLITLADMPYIKEETLGRVANTMQDPASIVAPCLGQQRGHPVAFGANYRQALLELDDDIGARDIIRRHEDCLVLVESDDQGIITDIDVPASLQFV